MTHEHLYFQPNAIHHSLPPKHLVSLLGQQDERAELEEIPFLLLCPHIVLLTLALSGQQKHLELAT